MTNNSGFFTTNQTGQADSWLSPTVILNGTQTVTAKDTFGRTTVTTTSVIVGGTNTVTTSQTTYGYSSIDPTGRNYSMTDLAARTTTINYDCCGLDSVTDPDGVLTSYTYDPNMRQITSTISRGSTNITTTNIFDGVGRMLARERIGSNGSVITNGQSQYDILGRVINHTNALNGVTSSSYSTGSNPYCVTNTNPDSGTVFHNYNYDHTLQTVGGSAAASMQFQYGVEQDGSGPYRRFTLAIKLTATGGTNEWTKTYTDGAGRQYKTIYSTNSGTPPFAISYFNSLGQLIGTVDPDGVATIYAYNAKGERQYTAIDLNQNGIIDYSGSDRITYVANDAVLDSGVGIYVQRSRTYAWSTNSNSGSNLLSTIETSTNGLISWQLRTNSVYGAASLTNQTQTVYGSTGYRYVTNTAPDGSYSVNVFDYGLLASVTRYDLNHTQILQSIYGYDPHGRQNTVTDARNGTTTYAFNNADQVATVTTPVPASGAAVEITTNYYDLMSRLAGVTLPDGTSTTNLYYPTSQLKQTYGSRTYPVGYGYDAQGRMTVMTNWANFATGAGARVTTWTYDAYRGFLTSKTYDGGAAGPAYTYTGAGRLATRVWARGITTAYAYNTGGDLAAVNYSDGTTPNLGYSYDRRGRQTSINNGTSGTTALLLNDQGQVYEETFSGGPSSSFHTILNAYDSLLRRISNNVIITNLVADSMYSYHSASRLSSVSDGTNSATYSYLANSPLVSQIAFTNAGTLRMTTTKSYDLLNRLTSISSANSSNVVLHSHGYAYNFANQGTSMTNADGTYWIYQYDSLGQMTSGIKYWPDGTVVAGQQFGYGFDNIGNRQTSSAGGDQWGANLRYQDYTANTLNQHVSRTVPGTMDVIGVATNAATVTVNNLPTYRKGTYYRAQLPVNNASGPVSQTVTNLAVLVEGTNYNITTNSNGNVLLPPATQTFSYDADGNTTSDSLWNYGWGGENRLVHITNVSTLATSAQKKLDFVYDYLSRRIQKIVSTNTGASWVSISTNVFIYDASHLIAEADGADLGCIRSYEWGLDLSGSTQGYAGVGGLTAVNLRSVGSYFVAYGGRGDVAAFVNAGTGLAAGAYEYAPFGELIKCTEYGLFSCPLRYSTKYQDSETDLTYYGRRYYCNSGGAWLGRDPLDESDEMDIRGISWLGKQGK